MRVIGIIPARLNSTRIPQKMLLTIKNKPLIQYTYENAKLCKAFNDLVIATDSEKIQEKAESFGAQVIMTDSQHRSGTDRVAEVARSLEADIVVNIQGDEPFISPDDLNALVAIFEEKTVSFATLAYPISYTKALDPNTVKVVLGQKNRALYFSRAPIPFSFSNDKRSVPYLKHIGVYAYRRETLLSFSAQNVSPLEKQEQLEQLRAIESGTPLFVHICQNDTLGIDTREDIERAKKIILGRHTHV